MGQCRSLDLKDAIVDQPLRNTSFGRVDAHHRISCQPVAKGRGEHFEVEVTVGEAKNQLLSGEHHADPRVSAVAQLQERHVEQEHDITERFPQKIVGGQEGKTVRFQAGTGACQEAPSNFSKPPFAVGQRRATPHRKTNRESMHA